MSARGDHRLQIVLAGRDATRQAFSSAQQRIRGFTRSIVNMRNVMIGFAGAAGIGYLIKRNADLAGQIGHTADAIGLSTDALQEYRYIAERSNVATSQLDGGIGTFTKRLGELRSETGALHTFLGRNNEALAEQLRQADSTDEALRIYFDALKDVENQSDRNAMAAAAFSKANGIAMTNMVDQIDPLRERFERLGLRLDEDIIRQSQRGSDAMDDLASVIRTSFTRAMASAAEPLGEIATGVADWVTENDDFLRQDMPEYLSAIARDIGWIAKNAASAIGFLKEVHEWLGHVSGRQVNMGVHFVEEISRIQEAIRDLEHDRERIAAQQEFFPGMGGDVSDIDRRIEALKQELYTIRQQRDAWLERESAQPGPDAPDTSRPPPDPSRPPPDPPPSDGDTDPVVKTPRFDGPAGAVDVTPQDIERAYTRMYDRLGQESRGYYNHQVMLLQAERDEWIRVTNDRETANEAYYSSLEDLSSRYFSDQEESANKWVSHMENAFDGWATSFTRDLNEMVWGADSSFSDIAESFGKMITQMIIQYQMAEHIMQPLFGWMGDFGGSGSAAPSGHDPTYNFARGGVVRRETLFPMTGGRTGRMGEAGPEAILPLTRVGGDLGVKAQGAHQAQSVRVSIHNESSQQMEVTDSRASFDAQGMILDLWIDAYERNKRGLRNVIGGR